MIEWFKNLNKFYQIMIIAGVCIGSILVAYKFYQDNKDLPKEVVANMNSATSKQEDLDDISNKLNELMLKVQEIKNDVELKKNNDTRHLKSGINNTELDDWCISISGKNSLKLLEGDKVLIQNIYVSHKPSAIFTVKFIRNTSDEDKPEIYMNINSAEFLGIINPLQIGIFDINIQKMP